MLRHFNALFLDLNQKSNILLMLNTSELSLFNVVVIYFVVVILIVVVILVVGN